MDDYNIPFYIGECAPSKWNNGSQPYGSNGPWDYLDKILTDFNSRNWGWNVWTYKIRKPLQTGSSVIVRPADPLSCYPDIQLQSYDQLIDNFNYDKNR